MVPIFLTTKCKVISLSDAWNLADALNGFMAIPNLIAILTLSPVIIKLVREYFSQNKLKD